MKKLIFILPMLIFSLYSCGESQEQKAIRNAIYSKYKDDAIKSDTYVQFEVPSVKIKNTKHWSDSTRFEVEFGIMEMFPSRNVYYKGRAKLVQKDGTSPVVEYYNYNTCEVNELP